MASFWDSLSSGLGNVYNAVDRWGRENEQTLANIRKFVTTDAGLPAQNQALNKFNKGDYKGAAFDAIPFTMPFSQSREASLRGDTNKAKEEAMWATLGFIPGVRFAKPIVKGGAKNSGSIFDGLSNLFKRNKPNASDLTTKLPITVKSGIDEGLENLNRLRVNPQVRNFRVADDALNARYTQLGKPYQQTRSGLIVPESAVRSTTTKQTLPPITTSTGQKAGTGFTSTGTRTTRTSNVEMPDVTPTAAAGAGGGGGAGRVGSAAAGAADDAADAATTIGRKRFRPTKLGVADTALTLGALGVGPFETATGIDVPWWLESALYLGGGVTATKYGSKLAKSAPDRKTPLTRNLSKYGGKTLQYTSIPGGIGASVMAFLNRDQEPPIPVADGELRDSPFGEGIQTPVVAPEDEVSRIDQVLDYIDQSNQILIEGYNQDMAAIDAEAEAALSQLLAAVNQGVSPNDPILQQELANIEAQYSAGKAAIDAEYSAAATELEGYQAQADELMQELAQGMAASYQQASGELLAGAPGTAGITPEQAAAAGVSASALGGAGITGAALLGAQEGATQAAVTAGRLATSGTIAQSLNQLTRDEAAMKSNLEISRLEAERGARLSSAERKAIERENARQGQILAAQLKLEYANQKAERENNRAIQIAQANAQSAAQKANFLANLDPTEYKQWKGSGGVLFDGSVVSSWKYPAGNDPATLIDPEKIPNVNIEQATLMLEQYDLNVLNIVATAGDRDEALADALELFSIISKDPEYMSVLRKHGRPTSPSALVNSIISAPPAQNPTQK
jgi:hypothetical protein